MADRVKRTNLLCQGAENYQKGCSGFVCTVLKIDWEDADDLMGNAPK
jgi:hypothetical protein